jgi:transposase
LTDTVGVVDWIEGGPAVRDRRSKYDEQFRRDAVDLLLSSGKPLKPLAKELGVSDTTLRAWRDAYLDEMEGDCGGSGAGPTPREMAEEIRRLRRELERVTRQREILKKALGILSDQSPGGMP